MALCIRHEPLPSSISATDPTRCIKKDHFEDPTQSITGS